jgi:hypothetical protein
VALVIVVLNGTQILQAQQSVARQWNEALLFAIRNDLARPTVHARTLWYSSMIMYDSWAILDPVADTYLLGNTVDGFNLPFTGFPAPANVQAAQEEILSHAAYRFLSYQFGSSPNWATIQIYFDSLMTDLGYSILNTGIDYSTGDAWALGNHLGYFTVGFELSDGANQTQGYQNQYYQPVNGDLNPLIPGNAPMSDPNKWQPLALLLFIDQAGNILTTTPEFQGAEWGWVRPFAMTEDDRIEAITDTVWNIYHDPGSPPWLWNDSARAYDSEYYRWGFELVSKWGSHLDPSDSVMWDISPASIGNIQAYPDHTDLSDMEMFYDEYNGGDASIGHALNPHTGLPYPANIVPRGDYARVLAEFWADGPDSETPPGHWFVILNKVSEDTLFEKRWNGVGPILDDLEWDVKSYFAMGGAMHDAAIAAWSVKGWYDYPRPISILRWMADRGQCTDSTLISYDPEGIQLDSGYIELVLSGDSLEGDSLQNIGKIKLRTWIGTDSLVSPDTTVFGVDWILAENWWPYQRPTFVTPPFAGYVSGHSTYSRAAAEVMTLITGDPFFPGGVGEFVAEANQFLVFEDGPSVDVMLQWATYFDAADQCSLSRIWGGIHPPQDDIPGRKIGQLVGPAAFSYAESFFNGISTNVPSGSEETGFPVIYPNVVTPGTSVNVVGIHSGKIDLFDDIGRWVDGFNAENAFQAPAVPGTYYVRFEIEGVPYALRLMVLAR